MLGLLDGRELAAAVEQAAKLLATVLGQDLQTDEDGVFRIARRVAKDRVISTVDPDTRHGHETSARAFDGYQAHAAVDPDSEIITAATVTPGNAGHASVAEDLIADLLDDDQAGQDEPEPAGPGPAEPPVEPNADAAEDPERACVYGDNAYGTGSLHNRLELAGIADRCKTQTPTAAGWVVQQGPVRHRPRRRRGDLPGRGSAPRSARPATAAAPPSSPRAAPRARCARSAPPPPAGARCP